MKNFENSNSKFRNENQDALKNASNEKKEGVTRGTLITGLISLILLIAVSTLGFSLLKREQKKQLNLMEDQRHSFSEQLTARDSVINEWILTFNQIEKDLNTLLQKQAQITVKSSDSEFSKDVKQQILEDIKYINTLLDQNKKKIASLSAQLKKSGGAIKGLQDKIAELESSMKQRDEDLSKLKVALLDKDFEIGQLNTRMADLQINIEQKDKEISNQTAEMNKAFLVYGTFKELKEKGLVTKEGGFFGIGRKESLIEDFADSSFAQINLTETKTIPVDSKSAKLITEHPSSSYELIRENKDKIAYIEIKNPNQFWKISKYAVVELIK